jgi:hypothetical protein
MNEDINIYDSIVSKGIGDITSDLMEAGIDQLLDNGFLKDIPIIGIGFKLLGLGKNISDSVYAKKILKFLFELKDIPQEKREEFVSGLGDEKQSKRAGENVMVILNKLDDINKASIVGKLLKATILNRINYSDFIRLSHIVDKVFLYDLIELKQNPQLYNISPDLKSILHQNGLLYQTIKDHREWDKYVQEMTGGSPRITPPSFEYKVNEYGQKLIKYGF